MSLGSTLEFSVLGSQEGKPKVVIGGAPRSGSTYLQYILNFQYKNTEFETIKTHLESDHLAHINNSTDTNFWLVPIRDPKDTVKSMLNWFFYEKGQKNLEAMYTNTTPYYGALDSLTRLWETILLDKKKFTLLDFDVLISNRSDLESKIEKSISFFSELREDKEVSNDYIKNRLINDDKETLHNREEKAYLHTGHLPREKSDFYDDISRAFDSQVYARRFEYLYQLKVELLSE